MIAAAFLVFLLITGVPLQYSGALALGQQYVTSPAILDWYGLEAPQQVQASAGLVSVGEALFLPGVETPVAQAPGFRGAVNVGGLTAAASNREVLLLDPASGELLDRFAMASPVSRIGVADGHVTAPARRGGGADAEQIPAGPLDGRVVVETADGMLMTDADLLNWRPIGGSAPAVTWAALGTPNQPDVYRQHYRARMLTVERLLQDAHSGRLLGTAGVLLVDAASLLLLFLAISGLLIWWRTFRR